MDDILSFLNYHFQGKGYHISHRFNYITYANNIRITNLNHARIRDVSLIYWGKGDNFWGERGIPFEVAFIGMDGDILYHLNEDDDFFDVEKFFTLDEAIKHINEKLMA